MSHCSFSDCMMGIIPSLFHTSRLWVVPRNEAASSTAPSMELYDYLSRSLLAVWYHSVLLPLAGIHPHAIGMHNIPGFEDYAPLSSSKL